MPKAPRKEKFPFTTERAARNSVIVNTQTSGRNGWEQWFLLSSDRHHDNQHTDQALELKHLKLAAERGAGLIDDGDLHCAMQGKYDRRSSQSSLRPEHRTDRYLDALVETASDFYAPFAANWILMGCGNHEQSIFDRHHTHLTERTVALLNARGGSCLAGGYTNWVTFRFHRQQQRTTFRLWMCHGYGGGGPATKDMIQLHRQLAYVRDADFMLTGHTHDQWITPCPIIGCGPTGEPYRRTVWGIKGGTYKDEYADGNGGWHVETGKPPKPIGAWWLRFYWDEATIKHQIIIAD